MTFQAVTKTTIGAGENLIFRDPGFSTSLGAMQPIDDYMPTPGAIQKSGNSILLFDYAVSLSAPRPHAHTGGTYWATPERAYDTTAYSVDSYTCGSSPQIWSSSPDITTFHLFGGGTVTGKTLYVLWSGDATYSEAYNEVTGITASAAGTINIQYSRDGNSWWDIKTVAGPYTTYGETNSAYIGDVDLSTFKVRTVLAGNVVNNGYDYNYNPVIAAAFVQCSVYDIVLL